MVDLIIMFFFLITYGAIGKSFRVESFKYCPIRALASEYSRKKVAIITNQPRQVAVALKLMDISGQ